MNARTEKKAQEDLDGSFVIDGNTLNWSLLSEPLWSTEHGHIGMRLSMRVEDRDHREIVLEYPYPKTKGGSALPLPQRPSFSAKIVEADVRKVLVAGWDPYSRGKVFVYPVKDTPIEAPLVANV